MTWNCNLIKYNDLRLKGVKISVKINYLLVQVQYFFVQFINGCTVLSVLISFGFLCFAICVSVICIRNFLWEMYIRRI